MTDSILLKMEMTFAAIFVGKLQKLTEQWRYEVGGSVWVRRQPKGGNQNLEPTILQNQPFPRHRRMIDSILLKMEMTFAAIFVGKVLKLMEQWMLEVDGLLWVHR